MILNTQKWIDVCLKQVFHIPLIHFNWVELLIVNFYMSVTLVQLFWRWHCNAYSCYLWDVFIWIYRFLRAVAYRWLARWLFGPLGWNNTRPLPLCMYHKIRSQFHTPEATGYVSGQEHADNEWTHCLFSVGDIFLLKGVTHK